MARIEGKLRMGVSGVGGYAAFRPAVPAVTADAGLSKQDQAAVIAARPAALRTSGLAAANLGSQDTDGDVDRGSVDTYL